MIATAFTKYIILTLTTLHLLDGAVTSPPNFETNRDLVDYLYRHSYINSLVVRKAMNLVDRKLFVGETGKPYEDSSQDIGHGVKILAPHVQALVLGALESRLTIGASAACILCHSGYLLSVMALYVTTKGVVLGIEKESALTNLNYDNIERWIASSDIAKAFLFYRHSPFQLYTRTYLGAEVRHGQYSATFYNGDKEDVVTVLQARLRTNGRLVYLKGSEETGQTLMVVDRLSNGSFHKRILADLKSDMEKGEEKEGEEGKKEVTEGEREVDEVLKEVDDTVTPTPVPPAFVDLDEVLITSSQVKYIPDISLLLLLVCIAIISCIRLF